MLSKVILTATVIVGFAIAAPQPTSAHTGWASWQPSSHNSAASSVPSSSKSAASSSLNAASSTAGSTVAPCSRVAQLVSSTAAASPKAVPTVPAQLAYECLNTIPFNQSAALAYLDAIDPYLQWQTTIPYLAQPPAQYAALVQPPYDFNATWNAIKANVSAGAYKSEYEFGWTVYRAAQLAHDGHFVFYPDSVTAIFSFGRGLPLVSTSMDGKSSPQPYVYTDIVAHVGSGAPISAITQINNEDATSYLLTWSEYGSLQDPDALYNNLFWEPAQIALGASGTGLGTFSGGGRGRWPYPGPTTTLKFANGSTLVRENYARVLVAGFANVTSGESVYEQFLNPPPQAYENAFKYASSTLVSTSTLASATTTARSTSATPIPAPAYPTPYVQETNNLNSGYFLSEPGYEDVAVLAVRSFVGTLADEIDFQAVNTYLIEQAAALGKKKLIIDVSANGGGTILQGYDLFKQLFPSVLPYGASRFRDHEAFNLLGEQSSYLSGLVPRQLGDNTTYQDIESSVFNYRTDVDVNYQNFQSWSEKYGPEYLGPDSPPEAYSSLIRWNLSDILTPLNSGGIYVSGYLNRSNITVQPFAPENIVIVTDGYCASTCTIFTELMTSQGGVKTVALGGRPNGNHAMQAIGGVKGTNDFPFDYIFGTIAELYGASNASLRAQWETSVLASYSALPLYRSTAVVVNARNGYLPDDDTPLQFVYEPANCRILYTPQMIVDETAVWKTVADSVWGGGKGNACVAGGFGKSTKREITGVHAARKDLDIEALMGPFEVETDSMSIRDGDSVMLP